MPTIQELKAMRDKTKPQVNTPTIKMISKRFYARIPGSKFIFSDGVEGFFYYGFMDVNSKTFPGVYNRPTGHGQTESLHNGRPKWEVYLEELEAICPPNAINPNIFTQDSPPESLPDVKKVLGENAVDEVSLNQAESGIMRTSAVKVEQQVGPVTIGGVSDPNSSTIDSDLLKAAQRGNTGVLGNQQVITPVDISKVSNPNAASSSS